MLFRPSGRTCLAVSGFLLLFARIPAVRAGQPVAGAAEVPGAFLRITGSSTMCPLIAAISERFRTVQPAVRIDVQCGGSDRGIKDLREGNAEIGMVSRALKADEKGLVGFPVARDGVSIIVNKSNPLLSLSNEQIVGIFSGKIVNWRRLSGKDGPIIVILREAQKPVTEIFEKQFDLKGLLQGKVVPGDNPVTIAAVAADTATIGYVSSGEAERTAASGAAIRLVAVGGVIPTERNIITGNYPLTRPLTLVTGELPVGAMKDFINFCLSSKVVDLIERFGFVPYED